MFDEPEYSILVGFCRERKGVMKCIDGDIHTSVGIHDGVVELEWMGLDVGLLQWAGESDTVYIDVEFTEFRGIDSLKRAVSYDAKCLAKGCLTVIMESRDAENEKQ